MDLTATVAAVGVLLATVALGLLVHETAHMLALRAFGVPFEVEWFPEGALGGGPLLAPLATVTPCEVRPTTSVFGLRLASLAPLAMALPMVLVLGGVVPDPVATGDANLAAATVGWLSTSLPSPQDFSSFWHAGETVRGRR